MCIKFRGVKLLHLYGLYWFILLLINKKFAVHLSSDFKTYGVCSLSKLHPKYYFFNFYHFFGNNCRYLIFDKFGIHFESVRDYELVKYFIPYHRIVLI
jgi:hypothetical protein